MLQVAGYEVSQELYQGDRMRVYQGNRLKDGIPVILKSVASSNRLKSHIARLKYEYEILSSLLIDKVIKVLSFEHSATNPTLILEDIGSQSLDKDLASFPIPLDQFFHLALQLVETLGKVHQQGIIHKDVTSSNILWNAQTGKAHLIDFDFSTKHVSEQQLYHSGSEGIALSHISPEQTGRVNRNLDFRTDFYSLGVTFYQWLTGHLPFISPDPMEIIYFQIAKLPISPSERVSSIPQGVSAIVLKLLSKTPEARYQNSHGLSCDLEICSQQYQTHGAVFDFQCGATDMPFELKISQKIYGRDTNLRHLESIFEQVQQGNVELSLISGPSGIGKSALVREFHSKYAVQARGYFCQGKFDFSSNQFPYFGLIQALRDLAKQLLTETPTALAHWKTNLLDALGSNGRVVTEMVPEIEMIIGEQPPLPELGPLETKNRFKMTFQHLMNVLAQPAYPLILFIDNMQWSDTATIEFIERLMRTPSLGYLQIICAYRDNEVSRSHPFSRSLQAIQKSKEFAHVSLSSLTIDPVNDFVSDILFCDPKKSYPLAELILEKTKGNPFFVIEFLKHLQERGCLWCQMKEGQWEWDLDKIQKLEITTNVIDIILQNLKKCSSDCSQTLHFSANLGSQFDLKTLAVITKKCPSQLAKDLLEAHQQEIISLDGEDSTFWRYSPKEFDEQIHHDQLKVIYHFKHDQIKQAVYQTIPQSERKEIHLRIGYQLLNKIEDHKSPEQIFKILSHFNPYHGVIEAPQDRLRLAGLNQKAAEQAKSLIAYQQAHHYITHALKFLGEKKRSAACWKTDYDQCFSIWFQAVECDFLCNKFEAAEEKTQFLLTQAQSLHDKATIQDLKVTCYVASGDFNRAIEEGLKGLQFFDLTISFTPTEETLLEETKELEQNLSSRKIEEISDAEAMKDPEKILLINSLNSLINPSYMIGNQNLFALITSKTCNLSLKHGNHPVSASAYVWYSVMQCSLGNYEEGYRFGILAVALAERFQNPSVLSSVYYLFSVYVSPWKKHRSDSLTFLKKGYQHSLTSGDFFFGGYSVLFLPCYSNDLDLTNVLALAEEYYPFLKKINNPFLIQSYFAIRQYHLTWMGDTPNSPSWNSEEFDEKKFFDYLRSLNYITAITWFLALKIKQLYCFEKYEEALRISQKIETDLMETNLAYEYIATPFFVYTFLSLAVLYPEMKESKEKAWKKMQTLQEQIAQWRKHCPENFEMHYWITLAELAALSGKHSHAKEAYDQAIATAEKANFPQRCGLAHELAAKYYWKQEQPKLAKLYMLDALKVYQQWGGKGKIEQLINTYPTLCESYFERQNMIASEAVSIDFLSIIKLSQAISKETQSDQLLKKLIQILLENTGARKVYLICGNGEYTSVKAWGEMKQEMEIQLETFSYEEAENIPQTLIRYVVRTGETIILADAKTDSRFNQDPYVLKQSPKSILCLATPSINGRLCILYLENNLIMNAFAQEHMEVLKIISSQVAISLENTELYERLQGKTEELTGTLAKLRKLNDKQTDIIEQERQRIAQELHDEAQQIFGTVERNYVQQLSEADQASFHQEMGLGQRAIDSAINELYPPVLRDFGFFQALEDYITKMNQEKKMNIVYKCQCELELPKKVHLSLFRIVQESLTNIYKYAQTKEAEVLVMKNQTLCIQISDQGKGFDPQRKSNRFGLIFMQERARQIGATVSFQSKIGQGTTIICKLPLQ